jgi:hypothetical protein
MEGDGSGFNFDFVDELGCGFTLAAFVLFLVLALVLWEVFLN